jgi:ribosomal protein L37AE/L43A
MKKCPNCGSEEFFVTAHVTQDWLVDKHGEFMQVENECVEVTHQPKDDDIWQCADCGYDAAGEKFEVNHKEKVRDLLQEFYDMTKELATSRHYTLSYWWIESNFGLNLNDKKIQDDVWEMSCSNEFCDLIQTLDFDDDKKKVTVMIWEKGRGVSNMKKYTLKDWEMFCKEALICPPFEDEEMWQKWIDEHKIQIIANGCEMELDYDADAVNEIEFSLREIYNAIHGDGTATTGNTVGSEYRNATWKDILRFAVLDGWYEDSHCLEAEIQKCICRFKRDDFKRVMRKIENQTSINDELEVNFFKLDTKDLWKIFDEEERKQAFKEILCSKVEISELMSKDGKHYDQTVIMDYSIIPSGDLVGWHYGVNFDKNSKNNQEYIQDYIERMVK